jgi:hypothetical protein
MIKRILSHKSPDSPINVVDVSVALTVERSNGVSHNLHFVGGRMWERVDLHLHAPDRVEDIWQTRRTCRCTADGSRLRGIVVSAAASESTYAVTGHDKRHVDVGREELAAWGWQARKSPAATGFYRGRRAPLAAPRTCVTAPRCDNHPAQTAPRSYVASALQRPDRLMSTRHRCYCCGASREQCVRSARSWKLCQKLQEKYKEEPCVKASHQGALKHLPKWLCKKFDIDELGTARVALAEQAAEDVPETSEDEADKPPLAQWTSDA